MYLKRMLLAGILALGLSTAQADNSVVLEMAWGIGGSQTPSKGIFLRVRHDKLEAHVGQWIGSAGEKNVVGLGYITQADKLTWTPGIAYMQGRDLVMFSRFAYEMPIDENAAVEIGLLGYGTWEDSGELFATAAIKVGPNSSTKDNVYVPEDTDMGDTGGDDTGGDNDGDGDGEGDGSDNGGGTDDGNGSGDSGGGDSGDDNNNGGGEDNDSGDSGGDDSDSNDGEGDNGGNGEDDGDVGDGGSDDDNDNDDNNQCERPGHGYGDTNQTHCFVSRR